MHEKVEHLLAQKIEKQNKLPLLLLSLHPQILFNVNFSIRIFTSKSIYSIVTFNLLLIFFDRNFYYFL